MRDGGGVIVGVGVQVEERVEIEFRVEFGGCQFLSHTVASRVKRKTIPSSALCLIIEGTGVCTSQGKRIEQVALGSLSASAGFCLVTVMYTKTHSINNLCNNLLQKKGTEKSYASVIGFNSVQLIIVSGPINSNKFISYTFNFKPLVY